MRKIAITMVAVVAAGALAQGAAAAQSTALASQARVTMPEARAKALAARPGRITDAELEKEAGGSGLRYSFDIEAGSKTFEVGVDAKSGALLENKTEGRNPD